MKRASPSHDREEGPSKRRTDIPPSPPKSITNSPELTAEQRILAAQKVIEREVNAKFELEYKEDIVKYMNTLEVLYSISMQWTNHAGYDSCFPRHDGSTT